MGLGWAVHSSSTQKQWSGVKIYRSTQGVSSCLCCPGLAPLCNPSGKSDPICDSEVPTRSAGDSESGRDWTSFSLPVQLVSQSNPITYKFIVFSSSPDVGSSGGGNITAGGEPVGGGAELCNVSYRQSKAIENSGQLNTDTSRNNQGVLQFIVTFERVCDV